MTRFGVLLMLVGQLFVCILALLTFLMLSHNPNNVAMSRISDQQSDYASRRY